MGKLKELASMVTLEYYVGTNKHPCKNNWKVFLGKSRIGSIHHMDGAMGGFIPSEYEDINLFDYVCELAEEDLNNRNINK